MRPGQLCKKNGELPKGGKRKVLEAAGHQRFNPFPAQAGSPERFSLTAGAADGSEGGGHRPPSPWQTGFVLWVKVSEKKGDQLLISERISGKSQAAFSSIILESHCRLQTCREVGGGGRGRPFIKQSASHRRQPSLRVIF